MGFNSASKGLSNKHNKMNTFKVGLAVCLPAQNSPETTTVVTGAFGDFPKNL
jgi:hypothetical protein